MDYILVTLIWRIPLFWEKKSPLFLLRSPPPALAWQRDQVSRMTVLEWASSLPLPLYVAVCGSGRRQLAQHLLSFLFPVYSRIHESEAWILRGMLLCTEDTSSSSFELTVMFDNFYSSGNCFEHYLCVCFSSIIYDYVTDSGSSFRVYEMLPLWSQGCQWTVKYTVPYGKMNLVWTRFTLWEDAVRLL